MTVRSLRDLRRRYGALADPVRIEYRGKEWGFTVLIGGKPLPRYHSTRFLALQGAERYFEDLLRRGDSLGIVGEHSARLPNYL